MQFKSEKYIIINNIIAPGKSAPNSKITTKSPIGNATIAKAKKMAKSKKSIIKIGSKGTTTNINRPPSSIHMGAVSTIKIKINGDKKNSKAPRRKAIIPPKTRKTSSTTASMAKATKTTKSKIPITAADIPNPESNIKSIVLGRKFQITHVGHKNAAKKIRKKFAMASTGKGKK